MSANNVTLEGQGLSITRVLNAPRTAVFRALTDPEHICEWFGPYGFSSPVEWMKVEPQVGGAYETDMREEETGNRYPAPGVITGYEQDKLLEVRHNPLPDGFLGGHSFRIVLEDVDGGTRLTLTVTKAASAKPAEEAEGWGESFDKLDALVTESGSGR